MKKIQPMPIWLRKMVLAAAQPITMIGPVSILWMGLQKSK